jgi:ribosomal protein L11 methyltransferase
MVELTLLCVAANAEAVSDALIDEHGALSASVEDADAGTDAEQALFGEPGMAPPGSWDRSVVKALFLQADVAHRAMNDLRTDWKSAVLLRSIEPVPDRDWVTLTQAQFAPTQITPGFWIVPSWHARPPEASCVIRLDPGMAFGTGTHPTTRMCLRWLARRSQGSAPRGSGSSTTAAARAFSRSAPHASAPSRSKRSTSIRWLSRRRGRMRGSMTSRSGPGCPTQHEVVMGSSSLTSWQRR